MKRLLAAALAVPEPFPWQVALLRAFLRGDLPSACDIPTGLGKTAIIAIWLVARALGAQVPRRLVYVVDRRAVVDQASVVAQRLRRHLEGNDELRALLGLGDDEQLPIATLRGQYRDSLAWLADPSAVSIIVGTVDMIGSRLLFEGYGVSSRMRPYHAGFLGVDTLIVIDEAHLVPPFERLLMTIGDDLAEFGPRAEDDRETVPLLRLLTLSATGRSSGSPFGLTGQDEQHPEVRRRLDARKRLVFAEPEELRLAERLAKEAWSLCEGAKGPLRIVVYCDRRDDAQRVEETLRKLTRIGRRAEGHSLELLVGARRVHERERVSTWLDVHGFVAGSERSASGHAILIATSAGEVGIDLDADHMVADLVPWERMVQRLGRVNRRGTGDARCVIVLDSASPRTPAVANTSDARQARLQATEQALRALPKTRKGYDASPGAIRELRVRARSDASFLSLLEAASTPAPLGPRLTRPLIEMWSMTSLPEHAARPDIQGWLRGWVDEEPNTAVAWRTALPVDVYGNALTSANVEAYFEVAPPVASELLETETHRVVSWFLARVEHRLDPTNGKAEPDAQRDAGSDEARSREGEGEGEVEAVAAESVTPDGQSHDSEAELAAEEPVRAKAQKGRDAARVVAFVVRRGERPFEITMAFLGKTPKKRARELEARLAGALFAVDAGFGGLDAQGLLDSASDTVVPEPDLLPVRAFVTTHDAQKQLGKREELRLTVETRSEVPTAWLIVESSTASEASTEEGRSQSPGRQQLLDTHQSWVERHAVRIAKRLSLSKKHREVLQIAAALHDEGKRAQRWQKAFRAPDDADYGKTASSPLLGLLDGYRHEFGSLLRIEDHPRLAALRPQARELCLHLIAAHHGFARPLLSAASCEEAPPSVLNAQEQAIALRFVRLEREWGPWGLAWWEALLRAADQQASRDLDQGKEEPSV